MLNKEASGMQFCNLKPLILNQGKRNGQRQLRAPLRTDELSICQDPDRGPCVHSRAILPLLTPPTAPSKPSL